MTTRFAHSVAEIAGMLGSRIEALAPELFPHGVKDGMEWRVGGLDGGPGRSLGVHLRGAKAGIWSDFASGQSGDALDLVAQVRCGGDKSAAIRWARGWLGLSADRPAPARPAPPPARAAETPDEQAGRRHKAAMRLFLEARPDLLNTPVSDYLAGRGIRFPELGRVPRALRFHPGLEHPDTCERDHEGRIRWGSGTCFPAMVAAIVDAHGRHIASHRTFLARDPRGRVVKASAVDPRVKAAKMTLGSWRGGAIHLWRGVSRKPWRDAPPDDVLAVCEGIEDALTIALAYPEWRIVAAISVGNIPALNLPATMRSIVLVTQRDGENSAVMRARQSAIGAWHAEGRAVRVMTPPEGFKDFNDWWQVQEGLVQA